MPGGLLWVVLSDVLGCGLLLAEVRAVVRSTQWWAFGFRLPPFPFGTRRWMRWRGGPVGVASGSCLLWATGGCGRGSCCLFLWGRLWVIIPALVRSGLSSAVVGWVASCTFRPWSLWL